MSFASVTSMRWLGLLTLAVALGLPVPVLAFPANNTVVHNVTISGLTASSPLCTDSASQVISVACPGGNSSPPTAQKFLSGSGTYTTPAGVQWIKVLAVGGGGGGGGANPSSTAGGDGGSTTFGTSLITSGGGRGGSNSVTVTGYGGTGGTATLAAGPLGYAVNGGYGNPATVATGSGSGGSSCLGGSGSGSGNNTNQVGIAGATNSGGGGGGAEANAGTAAGGGSGACIEAVISSPAATYAYAVGAAGTAGAAGTGGFAGGAGGSGVIVVTEYYTGGPVGTGTVTSVTGTTNQISVATGTTTPVLSIPSSPTLPGTTTVGNLINSGLTANQCIGANGSKQDTSSGEACPKSYQDAVRLGGLHVEIGSGSATAGAAYTFTFNNAYTAAPYCVANFVGSNTTQGVTQNPAPTTTAASFFNTGGTTHTVAGICIGL
jgi:hypothetical protein